jgi:hypothetical protein
MAKTVIILSPDPLYPLDWGSKRDIWGHVTFFHSEGWQVIFVECGWSKESQLSISKEEIPRDITCHFINRRVDDWSLTEHQKTISELQNIVDGCRPQIIMGEYAHFSLIVSALDLYGAKVWFRSHNFELLHMIERTLAGRPWLEWRGYRAPRKAISWVRLLTVNALKRLCKERLMHQISDRIFFISYSDKHYMSKLYKGSAVKDWVLPFVESEAVPVKDNKIPLDVIYVGIHVEGNEQTIVGANKLINEIIPAVEAAMPGIFRFNIVGRGAHKMYGAHASEAIVIHDYIENLSAFMRDMDIACLPIDIGWGCKIKMIEGLAAGLSVVGSLQTFRGVVQTQGAYYVCRTTQDYVDAMHLLQRFEVRYRTGQIANAAYKAWMVEGYRILRLAIEEST